MRFKIKIIFTFLIMFLSVSLFADEISIRASVNKKSIALNDYFVYSVTVSGEGTSFPEPQIWAFADFNRFGNGRSQSVSIINGKASGSVTYNYTLGPRNVGKFRIPSATVTHNGKVYSSDSIEIEITPSTNVQPPAQQVQNQNQQQQQQQPSQMVANSTQKPNVFVRASVNKRTAYENEKLVYKFKFYTNVNLASNPEYAPPDFSGFWNDGASPKNYLETIDGVPYSVNEVETTLYPVTSGLKTISPTQLKVEVMGGPSVVSNMDELFAAFFAGASGQREARILQTESIQINVIPLPKENKPNDFYGAVGKFDISASLDKHEYQTNEPITLKVTVTGTGNLMSVTKFDLDLNTGIKKYDTITAETSSSRKVFNTILIAMTPGEHTIPQIRVSYFNPSTKKYEAAYSKPIKIIVTGNPVNDESFDDDFDTTQDRQNINRNKDIKNLKSYSSNLIENRNLYLLIIVFIVILIGGSMFKFFKKNLSGKFKGSSSKAQKYIAKAEEGLAEGNFGVLYDLVYKALIDEINTKTGVESDDLTSKEMIENLKNKEVPQEVLDKVAKIFERLNFYKFAAVRADSTTLKEMLKSVKEIIAAIG